MILTQVGLEGKSAIMQPVCEEDLRFPSRIVPQILTRRYDRLFHFFFSKSIKRLIEKDECNDVATLKELQFWDDDREMLKRMYDKDEFDDRIDILYEISHPESKFNFHLIQPIVAREPFRKIMLKRTKRIKKYQQKLQEIEQDVPQTFDSRFLGSVDSRSSVNGISYSTSCHDIFENSEKEGPDVDKGGKIVDLQKMARVCVRGLSILGQTSQLISEPPQHLTLDFDDINEEQIIYSYKKLSGKDSFKKKYNHEHRHSYRKNTQQTSKVLPLQQKIQQDSSRGKAHLSPKLYSNRHREKPFSKRVTYLELGNESIETQNDFKRDVYKARALELRKNYMGRQPESSNPSSIQAPSSKIDGQINKDSATQFKAIRKRALELLSQQSLNSPKFTKARSPGTFTTLRTEKQK